MPPRRPPSTIRIEGETAFIFLKDGFEAAIDLADIHLVSDRSWRLLTTKAKANKRNHKYACSGQIRDGDFITLHRHLVKPPPYLKVDHRDGDGLNNRRGNIRTATGTQNNANSAPTRRNKLGVKGVHFSLTRKKFIASICTEGKKRSLGYFETLEEASNAYLSAATELWGEFAKR